MGLNLQKGYNPLGKNLALFHFRLFIKRMQPGVMLSDLVQNVQRNQ